MFEILKNLFLCTLLVTGIIMSVSLSIAIAAGVYVVVKEAIEELKDNDD